MFELAAPGGRTLRSRHRAGDGHRRLFLSGRATRTLCAVGTRTSSALARRARGGIGRSGCSESTGTRFCAVGRALGAGVGPGRDREPPQVGAADGLSPEVAAEHEHEASAVRRPVGCEPLTADRASRSRRGSWCRCASAAPVRDDAEGPGDPLPDRRPIRFDRPAPRLNDQPQEALHVDADDEDLALVAGDEAGESEAPPVGRPRRLDVDCRARRDAAKARPVGLRGTCTVRSSPHHVRGRSRTWADRRPSILRAMKSWLRGPRVFTLAVLAAAVLAAGLIAVHAVTSSKEPAATFDSGATARLLDGIPQEGAVLGRPDAPATLVEDGDVQCPYCAAWASGALPELVRDYVRPGKLRIEFRGLAFVGPESDTGLRAALAAGEQRKLWNVVDLLYQNQGPETRLADRRPPPPGRVVSGRPRRGADARRPRCDDGEDAGSPSRGGRSGHRGNARFPGGPGPVDRSSA